MCIALFIKTIVFIMNAEQANSTGLKHKNIKSEFFTNQSLLPRNYVLFYFFWRTSPCTHVIFSFHGLINAVSFGSLKRIQPNNFAKRQLCQQTHVLSTAANWKLRSTMLAKITYPLPNFNPLKLSLFNRILIFSLINTYLTWDCAMNSKHICSRHSLWKYCYRLIFNKTYTYQAFREGACLWIGAVRLSIAVRGLLLMTTIHK